MNGNAVRVVLWGETVGYLTWDSSNWRTTTAVFSFAKDFFDKNFSFLMDKHGRWSLAPAYDMVYSIDPNSLGIQKGQYMSIKGKVLDITEKDLLAMARENDINNPSGIISQVLDVVSNFRSYCEGIDVNSSTCDIMQKELNEKYKSFK